MPIVISEYGKKLLNSQIYQPLANMHLYSDDGELSGYGYEPQALYPNKWVNNSHPAIEWVLSRGPELKVAGYFVTDSRKNLIYSETFDDEPIMIGNPGTRISVIAKLALIPNYGS